MYYSLAIKGNGIAWGWGANSAGQLGTNNVTSYSSPVAVVGSHSFTAVAAGHYTNTALGATIALKADTGAVWAWGNNVYGQLGNNTVTSYSSPVLIVGSHSFTNIKTSGAHSMGLKSNGEIWCWGLATSGQLGDNSTTNKSSPVLVIGSHSFTRLGASLVSANSAGLKANGEMWSWGANTSGQLGNSSTTGTSSPVLVVGSHSFTQLALGNATAYGLKADGSLWGWGDNSYGQIGNNTRTNYSSPILVVGNHSFIDMQAANTWIVALKANGQAWCWGANITGNLGDGSTTSRSSPVLVVGSHSFTQVAAGRVHSMGLKENGEIWGWGYNLYGQIGSNNRTSYSSPVLVVGSHVFTALMNQLIIGTPTITDMENEKFFPAQQNITITGLNFGAIQGTGKVEVGDNSVYASANKNQLTVNSWSATSINVDMSLGALSEGNLWAFVTNKGALVSSGYAIYVATNLPWGKTSTGELSIVTSTCRAMGGTSPNIDDMLFKGVALRFSDTHTNQIRLGVYSGGTLDTSPEGATLLYETLTDGTIINDWWIKSYPGSDISLPKNNPIWVAQKASDATSNFSYSGSPSGDYQSDRGRWNSVAVDIDESVAYPGTWPADAGSFGNFWYDTYILYGLLTEGVSGSLGKTADGWSGAVPVDASLMGISQETYPYCRAKVDTTASETHYFSMAWNSDATKFRGTIYPGSWYGNGCADPNTGSNTVTVQLSASPDFTSIPYSSGELSFTTYITRRKTSVGTGYNYTDPVPVWNTVTSKWDYTVSDFVIYADTNRNHTAVAIPFHPTSAIIAITSVSFDGTLVSEGNALSTTDAWWWDSTYHTLYVQDATIGTTEVDVDISFTSDTDLWATRFDRVQTGDVGSRLFYNGLFIANQYLTTSVLGGGHIHAGMQVESRAHRPGSLDISTDCFERVAVHVDDVIRTDDNTSYSANIKWNKLEWPDYITSESNSQIVIVNTSDATANSGWRQEQNTKIKARRTQTYYSGKRYIKNVYDLYNDSTSTRKYPFVWQREQWIGSDQALNDRGRYYDAVSDATIDARSQMTLYTNKWLAAYDQSVLAATAVLFYSSQVDSSTYGIFKTNAFLTTGAPYAYWPIPIADHTTTQADNFGFEYTFPSVVSDQTVSLTFWHFHYYDGTSLSNILSAVDADYIEVNGGLYTYGFRFISSSTQYATSVSNFTPPANCSTSFWVSSRSLHTGRVLGHSDAWEVYFDTTGGIRNDLNWGTSLNSNTKLSVGSLYHVVMTRASDNARQIFINGALDKTDSGGTGSPGAAPLIIGRRSNATSYLDAYVEDVRIYNRVLSLAEAQTIYACKGDDNIVYGLLHRYLLNEGSQGAVASGTGVLKDVGITGNNMTPTNSPVYSGSVIKTKRFS